MKYGLAILACMAEILAYAAIGTLVFGWKRGGGIIPMMILLAIMAATWRAITRTATKGPITKGPIVCDRCGREITMRNTEYIGNEYLCSQCAGRDTGAEDVLPPPRPGKVRVICRACSAPLNVPERMVGKTASCPKCECRMPMTPDGNEQSKPRTLRNALLLAGAVLAAATIVVLVATYKEQPPQPSTKPPSSPKTELPPQSDTLQEALAIAKRQDEAKGKVPEAQTSQHPAPNVLPQPKTGWRRVVVPDVGTIDLPGTMEVQGGVYATVTKSGKYTFVAQQKGANKLDSKAMKRYVRVMVCTTVATPGSYSNFGRKTTFNKAELREISALARKELEEKAAKEYKATSRVLLARFRNLSDKDFKDFVRQALRAQGRTDTSAVDRLTAPELRSMRETMLDGMKKHFEKTNKVTIVAWYPATALRVSGTYVVCLRYKRRLGTNPPVLVKHLSFPNYDRLHELILSYREQEKDMWATDLEEVLKSFSITNVMAAKPKPFPRR